MIVGGIRSAHGGFPVCRKSGWFIGFNVNYYVGIDGISLFMVILTTFLMPICILCSWKIDQTRVRAFMVNFLILEALVIGVFCALDVVVFYLFFEGMLIPMYLIIGIWGGKQRVYAAYKFFLYTLAGSVLFLFGVRVSLSHLRHYFDSRSSMISAPHLPLTVQEISVACPCSHRLRSRFRCGRSIPGCPMRTCRRRRRAR